MAGGSREKLPGAFVQVRFFWNLVAKKRRGIRTIPKKARPANRKTRASKCGLYILICIQKKAHFWKERERNNEKTRQRGNVANANFGGSRKKAYGPSTTKILAKTVTTSTQVISLRYCQKIYKSGNTTGCRVSRTERFWGEGLTERTESEGVRMEDLAGIIFLNAPKPGCGKVTSGGGHQKGKRRCHSPQITPRGTKTPRKRGR